MTRVPSIPTLDHLLSRLHAICLSPVGEAIDLLWTQAPPDARADMLRGPHEDWAPLTDETVWGAPQAYFWFAGRATVPDAARGQHLVLQIDAAYGRTMGRSDPQLLVRVNGQIVQGADANHRDLVLSDVASPGETFDILIEAGTIEPRKQVGLSCRLAVRDLAAETLYFDLKVPLDVARHLPETDHRRDLILTTVYEALNAVDLRPGDPARLSQSIGAAGQIAARIYETADTAAQPTVTVTGHTHIDVAWLWRVRETRQKMARSMATALTLQEQYPDYKFMYNQGYLLETLSRDYPDLFERLRAAQARGQFEIEGALWLEPDANMTGGEGLVRQILRGVRYHQDTFGVRPRIVWLPDTFGYSAALPQIMRAAGLEVFVTHKMSWNDTNRMPHEVFWWQGIDGTRVPTYFLTTQPADSDSIGTTYCPDLTASHVLGAWRRFAQKDTEDEVFLVYGHGDGGGGPTRAMLEQIRRMERGVPGLPRVVHGAMGPFFEQLVARMNAAPERFPSWVGELYLEFHRGTFTSVAEVKRYVRRGEALLRELEALACFAMIRAGAAYPKERLAALWDTVLLAQFHDILPGSSIAEVYEDSRAEFETFFKEADALRQELAGHLGSGSVTFNPLGRTWAGTIGGACVEVPALSADVRPCGPQARVEVGATYLENARLRAEFDGSGQIVRLIDKTSGNDMIDGPANTLRAYRDTPAQFDAWDIDTTFEDQSWPIDTLSEPVRIEQTETGAALTFVWAYERSVLRQTVSLTAGSPVLSFDTCIDWKDPNTLLKAGFPLAVRSAESLAEIQFGHVARPSHANTSWDAARFETPMHRWIAMSEPGFGVALLNDCKYGYDAKGNVLRMTLLRAPTWPWDGADIGTHRFRYGIMAFQDLDEVHRQAEIFNHPLTQLTAQGAARDVDLSSMLGLSSETVAVEALKKAEDCNALILRLVERGGKRQTVRLDLPAAVSEVIPVDLLEQPLAAPETPRDGAQMLVFAPFEIKTLKLNWSR